MKLETLLNLKEVVISLRSKLKKEKIKYKPLLNSIDACITNYMKFETTQIELESFKSRDRKHTLEQNLAFRKELSIIKNDIYYKYLDTKSDVTINKNWFLNIAYRPIEILSGDSYSVRYINDNKILFFIFDAMGKGLSASITTTISTSMINHLIDIEKQEPEFSLERVIREYLNFIKKNILDEEVISLLFAVIDQNAEKMELSMFGMPPILAKLTNGEVIKIKSNNLPISKFFSDINIKEESIAEFSRILFYSDGLNEAITNSGLYGEHIINDFKNSLYKSHFLDLANSKIIQQDDDITFIYLNRFKANPVTSLNFTLNSRLEDLENRVFEVEQFIEQFGFDDIFKIEFSASFFELLFNAYEHGNFGIKSKLKNRLLESGEYDEYLQNMEEKFGLSKKIYVKVKFFNKIKKHLVCEIEDEGEGFDTSWIRNKIINSDDFHGRGVIVAFKNLDEIYYNKKANRVILIKIEK